MPILGFPYFHRIEIKPTAWGPPGDVAYSVRHWCENKLGATTPRLAVPFWEHSGNDVINYADANLLTGADLTWSRDGADFNNLSGANIVFEDCITRDFTLIQQIYTYFNVNTTISQTINYAQRFAFSWGHTSGDFQNAIALQTTGGWYAAKINTSTANQWIALGGTYDGSNLISYEDGVAITTNSGPSGDLASPTGGNRIGNNSSLSAHFPGTVVTNILFDVALTASQIALIHARPFAMFEPVSRPKYFFIPAAIDTDLFDGKLVIKNSATNSLDGKVKIKDTDINLLDGKISVKDIDIDLFDGKIIVKDIATILLDGKIIIKDIDTDLLDGKIIFEITNTDLFDGKLIIKNVDTGLLDGKVIIQGINIDLLDGKIIIGNITTNLLDGKISIKDIGTDLLDGKIKVQIINTDLMDGKIIISSPKINLLDGKLIISIGTFPTGLVTVQFTGKISGITFTEKSSSIVFTGKKSKITFQ